ncbi:MAG: GUN4 domain-containing protein, partial [Pseudanabaena sp.]
VSEIAPRSSSYIQSYSQAYIQIKQLQELLSLGQWQEGDRLTNKIILELANKHKIAEITADDIDNITCDVWIAIDQAWIEFSNQRFGWSTQKQIWKRLGGRLTYEETT